MTDTLLTVKDLHVEFVSDGVRVRAVNGVNFNLDQGETLALLGESGSGKSVTAAAIMDIIDSPPGFIRAGQIVYQGRNLRDLSRPERRRVNGPDLGMVFQDALIALNPVYSVGWQISEAIRAHKRVDRAQARQATIELLEHVGIPAPSKRVDDYPHEFSGGQRQRVMIAIAIALNPSILIADEPTTALDVTIQAQIIDLLKDLQREHNMGLLLITHDLGVVADAADRVAVMYAGRIVESAPVNLIFKQPAHPYTSGLLRSLPRTDTDSKSLRPIPGSPPDLATMPTGCPFHPRCEFSNDRCRRELPPLRSIDSHHTVACHHDLEVADA